MRLCDAPIGLFLFGDTLCLMTEYSSEGCGRHAYIVSSGEMFWGGAKSKEERANLDVTPVTVRPDGLRPRGLWVKGKNGELECNVCGSAPAAGYDEEPWETPFCPFCGAELEEA